MGKTEEWPRCSPSVFGRKLIRLQCYEGIDTNQALYEWDYARQMLQIRALSERQRRRRGRGRQAVRPEVPARSGRCWRRSRAGDRAVLLIDEVDRADDEFEAFLLELLSDFQITIPEIGTITADSAAAGRAHLQPHPRAARRAEAALPLPLDRLPDRRARGGDRPASGRPGCPRRWPRKVVAAVNRLRELDLAKPPGRRRDDRLGAHARRARRRPSSTPHGRTTRSAPSSRSATTSTLVRDNLEEITSGA